MVLFGRTLSRTAKCILTLERTRLAKQQLYSSTIVCVPDYHQWMVLYVPEEAREKKKNKEYKRANE